jgi:hypothetical protein
MDTIQRRNSSSYSPRFRGLRVKLVLSLLVAMLALPALAVAQSPSDEQYGGSDQQIQQQVGAGGGGPSDPGDSSDPGLGGNVGPLPFTGFDVIAMAAVALTVAGIGLALQRAVARESTDKL